MAEGGLIGWLMTGCVRELALFAAVGLFAGGVDDLLVDLIWLARAAWRHATVYRIHPRATLATLAVPQAPGRIAILIGALHEDEVIAATLGTALARWGEADYRIYVGTYPNDPETIAAIREAQRDHPRQAERIRIVAGLHDGPTTKAEALNRCWRALVADEVREGRRYKAVLLHDAEDFVHAGELRLFDTLIERFDLVQIPVRALKVRGGWLGASGHYLDEFSESHLRQMVVREAIGASVPSAGTGCAIDRALLGRIADARGGEPFDGTSKTEDYELGLRLREFGGRGVLVRLPERPGGRAVAVHSYFPDGFRAAVRQKSRWVEGIALRGWDRLGWRGGLAETWMRLRDRRAPLAAAVLAAAYLSLVLGAIGAALDLVDPAAIVGPGAVPLWLWWANLAFFWWRLLLRGATVGAAYGWREGLYALPRTIISSLVAIASAARALGGYLGPDRGWEKTRHIRHAPTGADGIA